MASEDLGRKGTEESAAPNAIVNLAEDAKHAGEGVKDLGRSFTTICKSLVAGGVSGGVTVLQIKDCCCST